MPELVRCVSLMNALGSAIGLAILLYAAFGTQVLHEDNFHSQEAWAAQQIAFGCIAGVLLLYLVFSVALRSEDFLTTIGPLGLEALSISALTFTMCVGVLSVPHYCVKIQGISLEDAFGKDVYATDSAILLTIDGLITAAHLGLPVRWFVLLPMEVASIILYAAIIFAIGSVEQEANPIFSLIVLTGIVFASAVGKRAAEVKERRLFLDVARERSKRCEAEFALERAVERSDESRSQRDQEMVSELRLESEPGSSVPTTTASGRAFELSSDAGDAQQLSSIARVGEAEHWRIAAAEVEIMEGTVLGSGGFGVVMKGLFAGMLVAVKLPHSSRDGIPVQKLPALSNELRTLRHLRHPNIVCMHGAVVDLEKQSFFLVFELVRGLGLDQFVEGAGGGEGGGGPTTLARFQIMLGISHALLYMHGRQPPIVHGDLKSSNIMVETWGGEACAKLLDFGLSRVLTHTKKQPLGSTLRWSAPEVWQHKPVMKCSTDMYSFGHLLTFVATGVQSLSGISGSTIRRVLSQGVPLPTWPPDCAFEPGCRPLVEACLARDEERRPCMSDAHRVLVGLPAALGLPDPRGDFQALAEVLAARRRPNQDSLAEAPPPACTGPARQASPSPARLPAPPEADGQAEEQLVLPERPATDFRSMCASTLGAISRWNFPAPAGHCCSFHAGVEAAEAACHQLARARCMTDFAPGASQGQCHRCGLLDPGRLNQEGCEVCGQEQPFLEQLFREPQRCSL